MNDNQAIAKALTDAVTGLDKLIVERSKIGGSEIIALDDAYRSAERALRSFGDSFSPSRCAELALRN